MRARAFRQRLDDLDGPDLVGEIGEIGRLIARAGADLEHLVAELDVDGRRHAAHHVRPRDRDAVADVQEGVVVGAPEILLEHEFLARHQQERALVALVQHVLVVHQRLVACPVLTEESRILAAVRHHPADIGFAAVHGRRDVPAIRLGHVGQGKSGHCCAGEHAGGTEQKSPSLHFWLQMNRSLRRQAIRCAAFRPREPMAGTLNSQAISGVSAVAGRRAPLMDRPRS